MSWADALKTFLLYTALGALLLWWHKTLMRISTDPVGARAEGLSLYLWDFLFYMVLGTVVTVSVQIAGVLMVFTLLVVPSVMSMRLFKRTRAQFLYVLAIGTSAVIGGSALSYALDLPTGAAIVCTFGVFLAVQIIGESLGRGRG